MYLISRFTIRSARNSLVAAFITGIIVTPIILTNHHFTHEHNVWQNLAIIITALAISGMFSWRLGTVLGSGSAIVIAIATVYLSSSSSDFVLLNFLSILIAVSVVVVLRNYYILKWILVALIDILVLFIIKSWQAILAITASAIATAGLISAIGLVGDQTSQVFKSVRSGWGPIIAYLLLGSGTIIVFALWYQFAFLNWPDTAFGSVPDKEILIHSSWLRTMPMFLYQALLIFATVDPPYPPTNGYTQLLVSLELICSILLVGIYLSLLVTHITQKSENQS